MILKINHFKNIIQKYLGVVFVKGDENGRNGIYI
jgi:hypothetical protein